MCTVYMYIISKYMPIVLCIVYNIRNTYKTVHMYVHTIMAYVGSVPCDNSMSCVLRPVFRLGDQVFGR